LSDPEQQSVAGKPFAEQRERFLERERDLRRIEAELKAVVEKLERLGRVVVERRGKRPWSGI
jgi:hypothetical protein